MAADGLNTDDSSSSDSSTDNKDGREGPLFYAYARRTDSSWASRYLLTFASAVVANEWWDLVQREYPDAGVRTSPQLFSFKGDKFPLKTADSKEFEHLKTKWFYSQIGDSDGTGGRAQDIIPLQDASGRVLSGGGEAAASARAGISEDVEKGMQRMQALMEGNAAQIKALVDVQSKTQERMERVERVLEQNSSQIKALTEADQEGMRGLVEQSKQQLQAVADGQAASAEQLQRALEQNAKVSGDMARELKRQRQQGRSESRVEPGTKERGDVCTHNVHPPPRKIDRPIVGYDYGQNPNAGAKESTGNKMAGKGVTSNGR